MLVLCSRSGRRRGWRTIRSGVKFYWLILGVLTVWRITHFLQAEDGPWDIVIRLRRFVGEGLWGRLLDCFYCLSVWIAAPIESGDPPVNAKVVSSLLREADSIDWMRPSSTVITGWSIVP